MASFDEDRRLREQAWIGDAVLALFAREWILGQSDISVQDRASAFKALTSNEFLASFGVPTAMEAGIGLAYAEGGLSAAFQMIETQFLPLFKKQWRNRARTQPRSWKRKA